MFTKARHTIINGGTFNQHMHLPTSRSSSESGEYYHASAFRVVACMAEFALPEALFQLFQSSAQGAAYNEQVHPPCHPGHLTLRTVSDWMYSPHSSRKPVLWLHGPSQALNSSIAKHVADKGAQRGELAGSFFSSESTRPKQNSVSHLVPTLALQLALSPLRGFQPGLLKALHEDPSFIRQPIPTQVERLILEPLQGVTSPGPFLVIIDALDQCEGEENQREVLAQLARIVQEPHNPLCFIITSTNAPHLRRAFDAPDLKAVSASSSLLPPQMHKGEPLQMGQAAARAVALSWAPSVALSSALSVTFSWALSARLVEAFSCYITTTYLAGRRQGTGAALNSFEFPLALPLSFFFFLDSVSTAFVSPLRL
ncbi:hypothetical protein DXG01_004490 [Tephrocybe rancida]|nr:hypothetical protein DXG01_004490 [Tephrocybe rancida]